MASDAFLRRVEATGLRLEPDELDDLEEYIASLDRAALLVRSHLTSEEPSYRFVLPRKEDD